MKKPNKRSQTKSRRTVAKSPRCFKKPTSKATWNTVQVHLEQNQNLNTKEGHTNVDLI